MSKLTIYKNPTTGVTAYVSEEGRAFYTANLLAELMGIETRTLTRASWFKGVTNYTSEFPEVLTEGGSQGVANLILAEDAYDIIDTYISVARTDCTQAKQLLRAMGKAGATAYAYHLCGFSMQKQAKMPTTNEMVRAVLNEQIFRTAQSEYDGHVVSRHVDDKRYQLNPKSSQTDLMGSIYAIARLGLEQDSSLQYTHLQNTVVKQYRQTQIAREGIESIPEGLLTQTEKKQLAKLGKACNAKHLLEANPSSKESELPNKLEGITLVSNRAA